MDECSKYFTYFQGSKLSNHSPTSSATLQHLSYSSSAIQSKVLIIWLVYFHRVSLNMFLHLLIKFIICIILYITFSSSKKCKKENCFFWGRAIVLINSISFISMGKIYLTYEQIELRARFRNALNSYVKILLCLAITLYV